MNNEAIGLGIFTYPVLMAADIVLYDTDYVPVGEDQVQHVEITRDLVHRFNKRYGEILKMPRALIRQNGARIMSLSDPTKKMSKSDPKGDIFLDDDLKIINKKIMSAVTDLDTHVHYDEANKPGISNLMTIYSALTNKSITDIEEQFSGKMYGEFKKEVARVVTEEIAKLQARYQEIIQTGLVDKVLKEGKEYASKIAAKTLKRVQEAIGLYRYE